MKVIAVRSLYAHTLYKIPYQDDYSDLKIGDRVIYTDDAEEETHEEIAIVEILEQNEEDKDKIQYAVKIIRPATDHDLQVFESYQSQAKDSFRKFIEIAEKYKLPMHPLSCTYSLRGNRAYFIFTASDRVDFRDFVKDLAAVIKKKIYLRQIGPRDRARMIGGYGVCGKRCCCSQFLKDLKAVNMDCTKIQGISSKGVSKLLGCCGKLLCCLNYETDVYVECSKCFPEEGQIVKIKKDKIEAKVIGRDILNKKVKLITKDEKFFYLNLDEIIFQKKVSEKGSHIEKSKKE